MTRQSKLIPGNLAKILRLGAIASLAVLVSLELPKLLASLKIDWYAFLAGVGVPAASLIWDWTNKKLEAIAKQAEQNRLAIADKFEECDNRLDRLTIQQQADEGLHDKMERVNVEVEKLRLEVALDKRLRLVEQDVATLSRKETREDA